MCPSPLLEPVKPVALEHPSYRGIRHPALVAFVEDRPDRGCEIALQHFGDDNGLVSFHIDFHDDAFAARTDDARKFRMIDRADLDTCRTGPIGRRVGEGRDAAVPGVEGDLNDAVPVQNGRARQGDLLAAVRRRFASITSATASTGSKANTPRHCGLRRASIE